ncbi:hypothetical protein VTN96DRAFT_8785 [Rasamsonia emersonii]
MLKSQAPRLALITPSCLLRGSSKLAYTILLHHTLLIRYAAYSVYTRSAVKSGDSPQAPKQGNSNQSYLAVAAELSAPEFGIAFRDLRSPFPIPKNNCLQSHKIRDSNHDDCQIRRDFQYLLFFLTAVTPTGDPPGRSPSSTGGNYVFVSSAPPAI